MDTSSPFSLYPFWVLLKAFLLYQGSLHPRGNTLICFGVIILPTMIHVNSNLALYFLYLCDWIHMASKTQMWSYWLKMTSCYLYKSPVCDWVIILGEHFLKVLESCTTGLSCFSFPQLPPPLAGAWSLIPIQWYVSKYLIYLFLEAKL